MEFMGYAKKREHAPIVAMPDCRATEKAKHV
jgi:hypothetical protein